MIRMIWREMNCALRSIFPVLFVQHAMQSSVWLVSGGNWVMLWSSDRVYTYQKPLFLASILDKRCDTVSPSKSDSTLLAISSHGKFPSGHAP
jgi:hypothetical protein